MSCSTAQQHLSAFHDDELGPELRSAVSDHLAGCGECTKRLDGIQQLSVAMSGMRTVEAAPSGWSRLEAQLDRDAAPGHRLKLRLSNEQRAWLAAAAAIVILSLSSVLWMKTAPRDHLTVDFDQYLSDFVRSPDSAQKFLLTSYSGRAVTLDEATKFVPHGLSLPDQLPGGFTRQALYLLQMPCCLCVQGVYETPDGNQISIFEHVKDQPVSFGSRPMIHAMCNGASTEVVQVDDRLAAKWKRDDRQLTVVGPKDLDQLVEISASLGTQL